MSLGLGAVFDVAVATAVAAAVAVPGMTTLGIYTPVGGDPVTLRAAVRLHDQPQGRTQRPGATVTIYKQDVTASPTDGATFVSDDYGTITIRTALEQAAGFRCEGWVS